MMDAYVVVAVHDGRIVGPFGYWGGDGWTTEGNAKVYHLRRELREACRDARHEGLPAGASDVSDVTVTLP